MNICSTRFREIDWLLPRHNIQHSAPVLTRLAITESGKCAAAHAPRTLPSRVICFGCTTLRRAHGCERATLERAVEILCGTGDIRFAGVRLARSSNRAGRGRVHRSNELPTGVLCSSLTDAHKRIRCDRRIDDTCGTSQNQCLHRFEAVADASRRTPHCLLSLLTLIVSPI